MEDEIEERHERKRKKKKKKKGRIGYYLYAFVVLILTTAIVIMAILILFHVQKIEITGTKYSQKNDILAWIKEDPYTSDSIYAFWKFKTGMYKKPEYLEKVEIRMGLPWELKIKVTEKPIAGSVVFGQEYVYFDRDGNVLVKGQEILEGIPVIEGVPVENAELYKKLEVSDKQVFSSVIELTKELQKNKLEPDRIVWEGDSVNPYFGGICVRLGKSGFAEKVVQIPPLLEKLSGKTGVLKMEYYNEMSTSISFREEVPENVEEN